MGLSHVLVSRVTRILVSFCVRRGGSVAKLWVANIRRVAFSSSIAFFASW